VFFDEGVYMRRTMHVLNGLGPHESFLYDHPFFGQIFLGAVLSITGYPNSLHPSSDVNSIATLYLVPRLVMGILAVFDTFLIYKIAEKRFGRNVAFIATLLFAVMPITWILRRILLDSILLPFLLSSILLALYSKDFKNKKLLVLSSGILLGLAIFTKIPAFTMIPLIAVIIYSNHRNNPKLLVLWFIPVILLPLIWPAESISSGQSQLWIRDVLWQTQRHGESLASITGLFGMMDPALLVLGIGGFVFAFFKRDFLILMWIIPYVIFLYLIGFNQYFYWIPVLPVFCIAAAMLIVELLKKIQTKRLQRIMPYIIISGIGIFGLISTTILVITNMSNSEFEATAFVLQQIKNDKTTTILASPTYSWIFHDVFHNENTLIDYSIILFEPTPSKVLLVADPHFIIDLDRGKQLQDIYNTTSTIAIFNGNVSDYNLFEYPYTSLKVNYEGSHIDIRLKK